MKPRSFWDRKIPSLFGIVILVAGVLLAGWMAQTGLIFTGRAAPGNSPQDITISNITDRSFTVSYTTSDSVLGTVSYGKNTSGSLVALDDRDQKSGRPAPYASHTITIRNLKAGTTYTFSINSGGGSFTNNGKPFTTTTGKKLTGNPPANKPVKGKIVTPDGSPAKDTLVYLTSSSSQILSALTGPDGNYTIPTASLRKKNLAAYITLTPTTKLSVRVVSADGTSSVSVLAKSTNPVPLITLSNKYDFATAIDFPAKISSESAEITGFPESENEADTTVGGVTITTPGDEQTLSDQRPTFKGTAPINTEVEITIDSEEPLQANVMSDRKGSWTYRPKSPIPPGEASITINARDSSGILKSATQSFTVLSPGAQFTEPSVSPIKSSPTPAPIQSGPTKKQSTPTPTQKITPTVTEAITPTPTTPQATPTEIVISISPTAQATLAPTTGAPTGGQLTPIQSGSTSTTPAAPSIAPTGDNDAILYSLIGAVAITVGAVLLFLTGGMSL